MDLFRLRQHHKMKISFLGPKGTFSHQVSCESPERVASSLDQAAYTLFHENVEYSEKDTIQGKGGIASLILSDTFSRRVLISYRGRFRRGTPRKHHLRFCH